MARNQLAIVLAEQTDESKRRRAMELAELALDRIPMSSARSRHLARCTIA